MLWSCAFFCVLLKGINDKASELDWHLSARNHFGLERDLNRANSGQILAAKSPMADMSQKSHNGRCEGPCIPKCP